MKASKLMRIGALSLGLTLFPASAYAVNVSANDGNGEQHRASSAQYGANVTGNLRSTAGKQVFYSGRIDLASCNDPDVGRYSAYVTQTTLQTRGGSNTSSLAQGCAINGVKSRVCTVRSGLPDVCGSDSSTY